MTQQVTVRLAVDAAELLGQLAPSQYKRGQYITELIRQDAIRKGLIDSPPSEPTLEDLQAQLEELQSQVRAAIKRQQD